MEITESMESLDYCTPLNSYKENPTFVLTCWQNVCLSDIWIPAHLLLTKDKSLNSQQINRGVYHTLRKEGAAKCTESFSVYNDSEQQEEEIFQSDSEEEILFSSGNISCEENIDLTTSLAENKTHEIDVSSYKPDKNTAAHKLYENINYDKIEYLEYNENVSKDDLPIITKSASKHDLPVKTKNASKNDLPVITKIASKNGLAVITKTAFSNDYINEENNSAKTVNNQCEVKDLTDSQISLNEILDTTTDINLKQFSFEFKNKVDIGLTHKLDKKTELNAKRMNKKERQLKKKISKKIELDELLQIEVEEDDCAHPFYQSLMKKKSQAHCSAQERHNIEFPELVEEVIFMKPEPAKFVKPDESHIERNSNIGLQSVIDIIRKTNETEVEKEIEPEIITPVNEIKTEFGKMVIENIPLDVTEEDIYCILLGYGEIKNFTLKPDGKFLKAFVEMDLICNTDWIVECLNGTDPFGASSVTLKCYNVTDS